jgi:hypothetical protein
MSWSGARKVTCSRPSGFPDFAEVHSVGLVESPAVSGRQPLVAGDPGQGGRPDRGGEAHRTRDQGHPGPLTLVGARIRPWAESLRERRVRARARPASRWRRRSGGSSASRPRGSPPPRDRTRLPAQRYAISDRVRVGLDRDAGTHGGDPLRVVGVVGEQRDHHDRQARRERAEGRPGSAVADDGRRSGQDVGLRDPALDTHVRWRRGEGVEVRAVSDRQQNPDREIGDGLERALVDA